MISPWAVLLTPVCDVDQKAELLRALTIEIFSEPSRAKFREEFFAFCMRIKFRWNQNSCEDVPDMFKRAGSLSRIRSDSVGKWDAQSGFKNWGGSPNGRKLAGRVCGFTGYLWAPLGVSGRVKRVSAGRRFAEARNCLLAHLRAFCHSNNGAAAASSNWSQSWWN